MPYTSREALTVALYNANVEPLDQAYELSVQVIDGLQRMGFEIVDTYHTRNLAEARAMTLSLVVPDAGSA